MVKKSKTYGKRKVYHRGATGDTSLKYKTINKQRFERVSNHRTKSDALKSAKEQRKNRYVQNVRVIQTKYGYSVFVRRKYT